MSSDLVPLPYPSVPTWRRSAALGVDFALIWLLCAAVGANGLVLLILFTISWFACRIYVVYKNQGQSLGRWAFDIRVLDPQFNRTPSVLELSKREATIGSAAFFAMMGLNGLTSGNAGVLLFIIPILIDGGAVLFDTSRYPQAIHDRLSKTIVVGSRRGYSLDIKIRHLIDKVKREMK